MKSDCGIADSLQILYYIRIMCRVLCSVVYKHYTYYDNIDVVVLRLELSTRGENQSETVGRYFQSSRLRVYYV